MPLNATLYSDTSRTNRQLDGSHWVTADFTDPKRGVRVLVRLYASGKLVTEVSRIGASEAVHTTTINVDGVINVQRATDTTATAERTVV